MREAQDKLNFEIDKITFVNSKIPVISNYDAIVHKESKNVVKSLKNQMSNKVKWTESIKTLEKTDISKILEIGPGKILSGLISRITKKFDIVSIDKIEDIKKIENK